MPREPQPLLDSTFLAPPKLRELPPQLPEAECVRELPPITLLTAPPEILDNNLRRTLDVPLVMRTSADTLTSKDVVVLFLQVGENII